jgi:uncharacterized membrane protein YkvA (DUF1232 family)
MMHSSRLTRADVMNPWLSRAKTWARGIKRDVVALYFAARDPASPGMRRLLQRLSRLTRIVIPA